VAGAKVVQRRARGDEPPVPAGEVLDTSVTSEGVPYDVFNGFLPENPHIRFFKSRERGYVGVDVSPDLWRSDLRCRTDAKWRLVVFGCLWFGGAYTDPPFRCAALQGSRFW
jgi:phosphodiesterase/alkaline phosphatase D-like protein